MLREATVVVTMFLASSSFAAPCPTALITTDTTIAADDAQFDGTALTIRGAVVTVAGHHAFCRLVLDDGAVMTHAAADTQGIDLAVFGSVIIEAGSRLDARGRGWPNRAGPGRPTVGTNGGAGHGGRGGAASSGTAGGACYGDLMAPLSPGSGGGGATGGPGGGVIRLVVDDTLFVGGAIDAGGANAGNASHSGGAGGSVNLTAGVVTGNGSITADGGSTLGAGGGRIRLTVHGTLTVDGSLSASGGHAGLATHGGGAGGGIRLTAAELTGGGIIAASGGTSANAGGGGGGRIAIYAGDCFANFDVQAQVRVDGGNGLHPGAPGTTFLGHDNLLVAGNDDAFAPPSEPAYQSAALQAALAGLALAPLDDDPAGGAVAVTFPGIDPQLATGLVALRLRAGAAPASESDRLVLGFADAGGLDEAWSRYLGSTSGTDDPGLVGRPWVAGADTTLVLDLSALPLADGSTLDLTVEIAARGGLDVVVRHHTAVDVVLMTYCLSSGEPIGVAGDGVPAAAATLRIAPNPFNPRTVVHFALAQPAEVSLAVYDLRGRRVTGLFAGPLAAGEHQLIFNASDLSSGAYLVRLDTGNSVTVAKALLVR